ncbi:peptidoglycan-binding LysM [Caloranaerobacter azorensis H53214]|uniref:Peptidoglycan-binding LysM n=1 Tax=Caloranaerobacter azorensis H53214 TaxID=1156417 RepID=A0A096BGD7_9FIRM|nr:SPOCS domain-containing protein [Caloranaerobacter azorensis]KGG79937.1 peptidoglycan-binding LysM [Caloranaerobacter azorensis H53214]
MAVELIKDLLKIEETIGKEEIDALIEDEISLSEVKPNIKKILNIDGEIETLETRAVKDKILINGIIKYNILYAADDENLTIERIEDSTNFQEEILINGAEEEMNVDIKTNIEHIDCNLIDSRKMSIKTVLHFNTKVQSCSTIEIVKDIQGVEGIQTLKDCIRYNDIVGSNTSDTLVKEAFELSEDMPSIEHILKLNVKGYEREVRVVEDKVIVSGVVECAIIYYSDDEESRINHVKYEIPFTHFVDLPGAVKDMDNRVNIEISNVEYDIREDISGEKRVIDIEAFVKISAKVFEQREKEVILDSYSTKRKFKLIKKEVDVLENIAESISKEVVKGVVNLPQNYEGIESICDLMAKPVLTDYRVVENKLIIEGLLEADILYVGESTGEIMGFKEEIPFKSYVDIDGIKEDMDIDIELVMDSLKFNRVNSRDIEIEGIVKNDVKVDRIKKIDIITEIEEDDKVVDLSSRPSITIYIVQKGDTLWDIAKRFNTTVDELINTNDIINPENIMPGEKIIIQKQIEVMEF